MKAPAISVTDRPLVVFLPLIDKQFEDHEKADSSADATNIMDTIAQCEEYILSEYGTTVSFVSGEEVAPEHSRKKFSHKERFETYIQSYVKKNANANKSILVFYNVKISKAQFATLIEAKEYSRAIIDAIVHFDGLPFHHKPALEEDGGEKEDKKDADSDDDYPMEEFEEEEISSDGKKVDENCLSGHNIADFVLQKRIEKDGLWNDLTLDGIDVSSLIMPIDPNIVEEAEHEPEPEPVKKGSKARVPTPPPVLSEEELEELERQKALATEAYEEQCEEYDQAMTICKTTFCELLPLLLKKQSEFQTWALSRGELPKSSVRFTPRVIYDAQKAAQDANQFDGSFHDESTWKTRPLYSRYVNEINALPVNSQTCGGVLYSMVRTVVEDLPADRWEVAPMDIALTALGVRQIKMNHSETGKPFSFSSFQLVAKDLSPLPKDVVVCELGNSLMIKEALCAGSGASETEEDVQQGGSAVGFTPDLYSASIDGLSLFEKMAMYRLQIGRLIRSPAFPSTLPLTAQEMGIQETELLSFSSLTANDFYRADKLQKFNALIDKCAVQISDFTGSLALQKSGQAEDSAIKRRYFRPVSSLVFQQILSQHLLTEPDIVRHYYDKTDDLLMILHWIPPARRMVERHWDPSMNIRLRISYKDYWTMVDKSNNEALPPPKPSLDISAASLRSYPHNSLFITPAGKSMVFVHSLPKKKEFTWVSMFVDDCIIGLRRRESLNDIFGDGYIDMTDEEFHYDPAVRNKKIVSKVLAMRKVQNIQSGGGGGLASLLPTVAKLKNEDFTVSPLEKLPVPRCTSASFFCENADQVRYVVTASQAQELSTFGTKPDGYGAVCLTITYPVNNLRVVVCSTGVIQMSASPVVVVPGTKVGNIEDIGHEVNRYICAAGTIVRVLAAGSLFSKDILHADGARTLVRSTEDCKIKLHGKGFYGKLLADAPDEWSYLRFNFDGSVYFYKGEVGGVDEYGDAVETGKTSYGKNLLKACFDAETLAEVRAYRDGRYIWKYTDHLMEIVWPDGTRCVLSPSHSSYYVTKTKFPSVEIDLLAERSSYGHAHGERVPLAKSGPRVRSRIACTDGTVVFVKYDVSITTKINGSLKCICRDRSRILAYDDGSVSYLQRNCWNAKTEDEFQKDTIDPEAGNVEEHASSACTNTGRSTSTSQHPMGTGTGLGSQSLPSSPVKKKKRIHVPKPLDPQFPAAEEAPKLTSYNFNVNTLACSVKDYEDNCFEIDLDSENPLEPQVDLAGELAGLKPIAVTDRPIEPKLYVVHRSADATEVVSNAELTERIQLSKFLPDVSHCVTDAAFSPSDLGGAKHHTLLCKKFGGAAEDCSFEEAFLSHREWHDRVKPAAASLAMSQKDSTVGHRGSAMGSMAAFTGSVAVSGQIRDKTEAGLDLESLRLSKIDHTRIYSKATFEEFPPLSAEGYAQLDHSLESWEKFRNKRAKTVDSFATVETRSKAEVEMEQAMQLRVAAAYKNAKMQKVLKKRRARAAAKEAARRKAYELAQEAGEDITDTIVVATTVAVKAKPETPVALDKIMEGDEDEESDSDYDSDDSDYYDEETPESIEMFAAFSEFSYDAEGEQVIDLTDIRAALIQLINKKVSHEDILDTYAEVDVDPDSKSIEYDAFIDVVDCYKCFLEGRVWGKVDTEDEEEEEEPHYLGDPHKLQLGLFIAPPKDKIYTQKSSEASPLDVVTSSTQALVSKDSLSPDMVITTNNNTAANSTTSNTPDNSTPNSVEMSKAPSVSGSRRTSFSPDPLSKVMSTPKKVLAPITPERSGGKGSQTGIQFSPDAGKITPVGAKGQGSIGSPGAALSTPAGSAINAARRNFPTGSPTKSPVKK